MIAYEERCAAAGLCRECDSPPLVRWDGQTWDVGCCHVWHSRATLRDAAVGWAREMAIKGCQPDTVALAEVEARARLVRTAAALEARVAALEAWAVRRFEALL